MDPSPDGVVCEADESQCIHLVGDHKGRVQSQVPFAEHQPRSELEARGFHRESVN